MSREDDVIMIEEFESWARSIKMRIWSFRLQILSAQEIKAFEIAQKLHEDKVPLDLIEKYTGIGIAKLKSCLRYGAEVSVIGISSRFTREIGNRVRERDKHSCRICKAVSGKRAHHVHHIFEATNQSLQNLITVCAECHKRLEIMKESEPDEYRSFMMWKTSQLVEVVELGGRPKKKVLQ